MTAYPKLPKRLFFVSLLLATQTALPAQDQALQPNEELYQFEPDTPARLVRAAAVSAQLDRIRLAREYLQKLVESELSAEQLVALRRDVGVGLLLELNANRDLAPHAGKLLAQVNLASRESALPESAAAELVSRLDSDRRSVAVEAAANLVAMGDAAVPALLVADTETESGRIAAQLLYRYRRARRYGLLNALSESDSSQQVRILNLLRESSDQELAELLLEYEFGPHDAPVQQAASSAISELWRDSNRPVSGDQAALWLTRQAESRLSASADPFGNEDARHALNQAVRFADAAFAISPHLETVSSVRNAALVAAGTVNADDLDDDDRDAALKAALHAQHGPAVLALLTDEPNRLLQAMKLADPAVRVAAAIRVLRLNRPVRGCSLAKEIIRTAAAGSQKPEAVVIDARDELGQTVFLLRDPEGSYAYEVASASTGQSGFEAAVSQLHCEVILIHANCLHWTLTPTIANLRNDFRTRNVPIVVYGADWMAGSVASLQTRYRGIRFLQEPLSPLSFAADMQFARVPSPRLSLEARKALIEAAREAKDANDQNARSADYPAATSADEASFSSFTATRMTTR